MWCFTAHLSYSEILDWQYCAGRISFSFHQTGFLNFTMIIKNTFISIAGGPISMLKRPSWYKATVPMMNTYCQYECRSLFSFLSAKLRLYCGFEMLFVLHLKYQCIQEQSRVYACVPWDAGLSCYTWFYSIISMLSAFQACCLHVFM